MNQKLKESYKKIRAKLRCIVSKSIRFYRFKILFPKVYKKYSKYPVDEKKVLFMEVRLPGVSNSFQLIYDELVKNYDLTVKCHFLRTAFVERSEHKQRCLDFIKDLATAKYVFYNEGSNVAGSVKIRPETKVCQTWHACGAFKKFGFSTAELIFGGTRKEMLRYPVYRNYTYVTVSSPEIIWAYAEAMHMKDQKEKIRPIGVSRTDIFFKDNVIEKAYEKLYRLMPQAKGKKVILYAPTFRGRVAKAKTPDKILLPMFQKELGDDYVFIFKHHPVVKVRPQIPLECREFAADFTNDMSIEELIMVSDICISDYSSLVFEYSLMERPMIFFAYDLNTYFDWRGFYYKFEELAPGPVCTTNLEMIDYIKNIDTAFDKEKVIQFKNRFMESCDGHATERIMEMMFGSELEQYKRKVPLEGNFYNEPDSKILWSHYEARLERLTTIKERAKKIFAQYQDTVMPSEKNIVFFHSGKKEEEVFRLLKTYLNNESDIQIADVFESSFEQSLEENCKKIAAAKYLIAAANQDYINLLPLSKESKVIQLYKETIPLEKSGYDKNAVKIGLVDDLLQIAPYHNHDSFVPVASERLIKPVKRAFGILEGDCVKPYGAVSTDLLLDKDYREKSKQALYKRYPEAEGKKIIVYIPKERYTDPNSKLPTLLDFQLMHEYCKDEYLMLCHFEALHDQVEKELLDYQDTVKNVTGQLSVWKLLSMADLVIGDYRWEAYLFAVTQKPLLLYAPDHVTYWEKIPTNYDYMEFFGSSVITNMEKLIQAIINPDLSESKRLEWIDQYLCTGDGNVSRRLANDIINGKI